MIGICRAILKFIAFILWTIPVAGAQAVFLLFDKGKNAYIIPALWESGACKIFGLNVETVGQPVRDRQIIYVSNHLSYLDIPVIGSVLKASFVAKADVAQWAVFGYLATLQQTAFISRARTDAEREAHTLDSMLDEGKSIILFPEGTSTDGLSVRPFKSSLFSLTEHRAVTVQPMTVELISVDGHAPDTTERRARYAWYGDMVMIPHLWDFAKGTGATVRLHFHPVRDSAAFPDRKALAAACYDDVAHALPKIEKAA